MAALIRASARRRLGGELALGLERGTLANGLSPLPPILIFLLLNSRQNAPPCFGSTVPLAFDYLSIVGVVRITDAPLHEITEANPNVLHPINNSNQGSCSPRQS